MAKADLGESPPTRIVDMVRWVGDPASETPRREKGLDSSAPLVLAEIGQGSGLLAAIKNGWAQAKAEAAQTAVVGHDGPVSPPLIGLMSAMKRAHTNACYAHGVSVEMCWYVSVEVMRAVLMDVALSTGVDYEEMLRRMNNTVGGVPPGVDLFTRPMYVVPGLRAGCFVLRVLHDTAAETNG